MTRAEIKQIEDLLDSLIARMGAARSATNAIRLGIEERYVAEQLNQLIEQGVSSHTAAAEASTRLREAAGPQVSGLMGQAIRLTIAAIEDARLAMEQLKGNPSDQTIATSRARDDEAIRRLSDTKAVCQTISETEVQSSGLLFKLLEYATNLTPQKSATAIIMILAIAALWLIYSSIRQDDHFLDKLAQIDYARGLITFLLSVGTIMIGLLLVAAALANDGDEANQKKFAQGKEVLTALLGIFGTILGFYFGSEKSRPVVGLVLEASPVIVAKSTNGLSTLAVNVSGGKPPYHYSIDFNDPSVPYIRNKFTKTGRITQTITNSTKGSLSFSLAVTDSVTNQLTYKSSEEEQIPPMDGSFLAAELRQQSTNSFNGLKP